MADGALAAGVVAGMSASRAVPNAVSRILRWGLFTLALVVAALFVTWRALAAVDFAYPVFYDLLGLGQTIERYGPQNDVRPGFHRTSRAERERVFGAIVHGIRHGGDGLEDIEYFTPDGRVIGRLLTPAEVRHLEDVAHLVGRFERLGWLSLGIVAALTAAAALRRERPPAARRLVQGTVGVAAVATLAVLVIGPKDVFYWLHEVVFPPDNQWFFYYQESLMSMMMRAPDLFGAIAALWLPLALLVAVVGFLGIGRLLDRVAAPGET